MTGTSTPGVLMSDARRLIHQSFCPDHGGMACERLTQLLDYVEEAAAHHTAEAIRVRGFEVGRTPTAMTVKRMINERADEADPFKTEGTQWYRKSDEQVVEWAGTVKIPPRGRKRREEEGVIWSDQVPRR